MAVEFPPRAFERDDEAPDSQFYESPRLVTHIDDYAIAAVGEAYRRFLRPGGDFLDLMSSWVSHFPSDFELGSLAGLGMNSHELDQNPLLTTTIVHDLNFDPQLPLQDETFDGVVLCVSAQYLTRPVEVFEEVGRVLKPGAPFIVTYSNRCFPTKAVLIWRYLSDEDRGRLVAAYAANSGAFESARILDLSPQKTMAGLPPDEDLRRRVASGEIHTDPLFAVVMEKKASAS